MQSVAERLIPPGLTLPLNCSLGMLLIEKTALPEQLHSGFGFLFFGFFFFFKRGRVVLLNQPISLQKIGEAFELTRSKQSGKYRQK